MNCIYGPYKITSDLESINEFEFIDNNLSRKIVTFVDCSDIFLPLCLDSIILHSKDNCPKCKVIWHECPSEMGRKYTILPSPCGIKITLFEDGLISSENCDATEFGSETFCFGKNYINSEILESSDQSSTTFEFDGHTFAVKGNIGECGELYDCSDCQIGIQSVSTFENLPVSPDDVSAPDPSNNASTIKTSITEIIPSEGRTRWQWLDDPYKPFGTDTLCEDEKSLTSRPDGITLKSCESNDNPSIATLPSGHTIVAYENRREDGVAKISVAILSSSVRENIRYHRKLGTGTLLNNLVKTEGIATFIVYEEMVINIIGNNIPANDEKIGFLTGPLSGSLFPITKITRVVENNIVRHEFNFITSPDVIFPDKNNIYNVNWFIIDNLGSADTPDSENIMTFLDFPHHVDQAGNDVPVANPSIAVAQNNLMVVNEQNIYVAYQAFENNQWRVYLREIILGSNTEDPPVYIAPYLFDNKVQKIEIMGINASSTALMAANVPLITFYDDDFSGIGLSDGQDIAATGRWVSLTDTQIPQWFYEDLTIKRELLPYTTHPLRLFQSSNLGPRVFSPDLLCDPDTGICRTAAVFNFGDKLGTNNANSVLHHSRSFAVSTIPTTVSSLNISELELSMELNPIVTTDSVFDDAEIWFLIGKSDPLDPFSSGYRIQIRIGTSLSYDTMDPSVVPINKIDVSKCPLFTGQSVMVLALYKDTSPIDNRTSWSDRVNSDGSQNDVPTKSILLCNIGGLAFSLLNKFVVKTYIRGHYRFFDIFFTKSDSSGVFDTIPLIIPIASFREFDETILPGDPLNIKYGLGPYHGFGFSQGYTINGSSIINAKTQMVITNFSAKNIPKSDTDRIVFHEDYFDSDDNFESNLINDKILLDNPVTQTEAIVTSSSHTGVAANYCSINIGNILRYPFYEFNSGGITHRRKLFPSHGFGSIKTSCISDELNNSGARASFVRILPSAIDRNSGGENHQSSVSMLLGVIMGGSPPPSVWFLGRLQTNNSEWYSRYRIKIIYLGGPNGDWNISAYSSGNGSDTDVPLFSNNHLNTLIIPSAGRPLMMLKINMSNQGSKIKFDVFGIFISGFNAQSIFALSFKAGLPDDMILISSFLIDKVPGVDGPYFGAALFTEVGASLSDIELNYLSLSTIADSSVVTTGACCVRSGGCFPDLLFSECLSPNIWKPDQSCLEAACDNEFIIGAGCTIDGICHDNITQIEADVQGIGAPAFGSDCVDCEWQAGKNCSIDDTVNYRNCPDTLVVGSCCRPWWPSGQFSPQCVDNISFIDCQQNYYGNTPPGPNFRLLTTCADLLCQPTFNGACCFPESGCSIIDSAATCEFMGGSWLGDHSDCLSQPCNVLGACCDEAEYCTQETEIDCLNIGNTFLGIGVDCYPEFCSETIGACCHDNGICSNTIEIGCTNGTWFYDSLCFQSPCAEPTGACCDISTGCTNNVTKNDCQNSGREFQGEGSECLSVVCPSPSGACCFSDGCAEITSQECSNLNGNYIGDFSTCISSSCDSSNDDPYMANLITYKPEDLWVIETSPEQYVTRVLYHMNDEEIFSSLNVNLGVETNTVDFMFLILHSNQMVSEINIAENSIPELANNMISKGMDVRFGFTFFGRGDGTFPFPLRSITCTCTQGVINFNSIMANGLQSTSNCLLGNSDRLEGTDNFTSGGFTKNVDYLQRAINCWRTVSGPSVSGTTTPWAAIQFAIEDDQFEWRPNADKFIFLMTSQPPSTQCSSCGVFSLKNTDALNSLIDNNITLIPVLDTVNFNSIDNADYIKIAELSGWELSPFDVNSTSYGDIFKETINAISSSLRTTNKTIIERSSTGTTATYLKKGEVIITYDGDLSDLWTFNKVDFEFIDTHVPFPGTNTKQLSNLPFSLASGKIYGIDSVHIQGNPNNWISFNDEGPLLYEHPEVGHRASGSSSFPLLISTNSAKPQVYINNRNQVIVAYENYTTGTPQIEIKGTGDFYQNSITGPKATRITRMLNLDDFSYNHTITLLGEGINQLCDFVIDNSDITHIVWESSRDNYWEIYYANSFNLFDPVRITQFESRSSHPSIDIDESGSIFVVYHDDRFGPFNIMLASKDEERVISLLEQDAYLASLRTGYTHYTNTIPTFIDNPSGAAAGTGSFWATKKDSGSGNDSENFVYKISETTGTPSDGFNLESLGQEAIAFSSTSLLGIASDGLLSRIGVINNINNSISFEQVAIGSIDLDINGFTNHTIVDMTVDNFDRIWVLISEIEDFNPSSISIQRLRLECVSSTNASTIARGLVKTKLVNGPSGGSITVTSDNKFYITWNPKSGSGIILSSSFYPNISNNVAIFNFSDVGILNSSIIPVSMASDFSDTLFIASSDNDLYTVSKINATTTFKTSLTSGSGVELSLPVGTTAGLAYQVAETSNTGEAKFFHIRLDFYDNITFEGNPFLSVDSRDNLEAFINKETTNDPYIFGMDARGIFLELDEIGIVFFDVAHFVPGFSRLSQPYSFNPNQTYFIRVFQIDANEVIRESGLSQLNSFSCTKCSRFGNNNFNTNACSYSFVMPNSSLEIQEFNFQIDFYADTGKQHLIRRFEAAPGSNDLQYMEVDNKPAINQWNNFGLPIEAEDSAFIQIHPTLDPTAGFLCGITYTVQVNECHDSELICSEFSQINPSNWSSISVGGSGETIKDQLSSDEVMLGLSMKIINNKLSVAWISTDENLKFAQFDGTEWTTEVVFSQNKSVYCNLASIKGLPSIALTLDRGQNSTEGVTTLENGSWNFWPNMTKSQSNTLFNPRSLLEYSNNPMTTEVSTGNIGQPSVTINDNGGSGFPLSQTLDTDSACFPPFAGVTGGSCTTSLARINALPAVAWIASGEVRYSLWNTSLNNFSTIQTISNSGDSIVAGKIALAEINKQPAIAYLKVSGSKVQLIYKKFDGSAWVEISTNSPIDNLNKNIAMASINNQPYIVYSVQTSSSVSQLRYAFYNGSQFVDEVIESELNNINHVVDIVEYNNEPAVIISANPFRIYLFRQLPSQSVNEIRSVFFCECASKIFTDRLTNLNEINRWESSAQGFSDTLVTDSAQNSLRPVLQTRKTEAAIILWEDYNESSNCSNPPCIRAATFRNTNQDQLRGSGTKKWFDYDFGISGQDPDMTLDIYDRINSIYEKPKGPSPTGLHGNQISKEEIPENELYGKVCDFAISVDDIVSDIQSCDLSSLENNVISFDKFISDKIVRKIRVKNKFVQYYTYNASGALTPIVSTCNIALEIHGTPEIIALRTRNEDTIVWSSWCPWSPLISDFVMEKEHQISGGSGVKEVCIQAMTYSGITAEFCLPIVADYETVVFETKFYKSTNSEGVVIAGFETVDSDGLFTPNLDTELIELPLSEGISVASLSPEDGTIVNNIAILVEIIPNQEFDKNTINFDMIQQGANDTRGLVAFRGKNNEGRVLYRGHFMIEKEDKVFNVDGLARISPAFPSSCANDSSTIISTSDLYTRDILNEIGVKEEVEPEVIDSLAKFRQTTSGQIGAPVNIRSLEDPYFIFGDPKYSTKKSDGKRLGVPFKVTKTNIQTGNVPNQGDGVDPPLGTGG